MSQASYEIDPLTRLAIRHGTDKFGPHFYTPVYHQLFSHLRDQPVRLLEIGIGGYGWKTVGGSSLKMWAEYFPNGRIASFDIEEKRLDLGSRITLRQGSQDDPEFLARLCQELGPFDIVIDDGSHLPGHVVASFDVLFPRMADGGLYVIEDVQTGYWPMFGGSAPDGGATMKLVTQMLQHINHAEIRVAQPGVPTPDIARQIRSLRVFHNLVVVEKGDNGEPSNFGYTLENPHAARALAIIEQEVSRSPTPEGHATLAMLYVVSGQRTRARALLEQALSRWPTNPLLLMVGIDGALEVPQRLEMLERLVALEPDRAPILAEQTRLAIAHGAPAFMVAAVLGANPRPPGAE